ncbi:hypothetical protein DFH11DRAFT_1683586 [Phellopilus nigrolimitatus]|nr:hypothetical protein DFH11DRAFT_1683586 [Phellopilus nigrolimitatus]
MALAMDSPAVATEDLGVTRLAGTCDHLFCRKDISTWILQNDSCPTCRRPFVEQLNPEQNDRRDPRYDTTNLGFSGMQITGEMVAFMRAFRDATEVDGEPEGELEDIDSRPRDHGEEAQERDEFIGLYS